MNEKVLRIGHRGAAGYAPENTLAAINKGIDLGADFVEIDIQLTADKELVVMHDKRVDRTTNGKGLVTDLTLAELRALDAGQGERIPLLTEVLDAVNGRVGLMAEIITPGIAAQVVDTVRRAKLTTPIIYASFLHSELLNIRIASPGVHTLALQESIPVMGAQFALDANATHVGLGFDSVSYAFVRELQARDLNVFVYTLNDPRDIRLAQHFGVDGIVSNFPDRI